MATMNEVLSEYAGELVPACSVPKQQKVFVMSLTAETDIDATTSNSIAKMLNHSRHRANCTSRIEQVRNITANILNNVDQVGLSWKIFLYSTMPIPAGSELLYDYHLTGDAEWVET
jgi:hypothetical protein